uniref:ATP synthase mitochondrial F1 complex assembly factor 2 n=1 Tax=Oryzias latipes TaxID=8090 RepID=A0A3P9IKW9_ORYLA
MFRRVFQLRNSFGNVISVCKSCPSHQYSKCLSKYSTASTGNHGLYEINLDRRKLKTPGGKLFTVPNEALAIAVATEWDAQSGTLKFYTMHLTTLCNTALDNPTQRNKEQMINSALKFLETDTICRLPNDVGTVSVNHTLICIFSVLLHCRYNVTIGSSSSILGPEIPQATKETFRQHLNSYSLWSLTGLEFVISQLKSILLSLGMVDRYLTVEQAVLLSRLEEEYQISHWGNVEWAHDYDMYELRARTAAGALFIQLSSENLTVKHKIMQD